MEIEIRVRYHETDSMGVVHHANYFHWFEMARIALIRERGFSYADWEKEGFFLPVIEAHCQYLTPVRFDDMLKLTVHGPVPELLRLHFTYTLTNKLAKKTVASASTTHVAVDKLGKPKRRWPETLKRFLEPVS